MLNTIVTYFFIFIFVFFPIFCIFFFVITLVRDLTRNFNNLKVKYIVSTHNKTGKTILELRYFIWELRKRKYFINLIMNSEVIYLDRNIQITRGVYYKDVPPLNNFKNKSFFLKSIRIFEK